jgi:hypoxia up-regulated 1
MGAGSTTATVLRMNGRSVKDVGRFNKTVQEVTVLGTGWDRTLGGDALNHIILDDMVAKFVETPGVKSLGKTSADIKKHGRTGAKLWREAEKIRQVLSANQQTVASFEGLYEDVDFKYKVTRGDFETAAAPFAERLESPVNHALKSSNLTFADIDSVILHGGATRTPCIQKKLEDLAGDASKLRSNVNADEAAVFGAAFKAARLSPSFRVKEIRDYDTSGYSTLLYYQADGKSKSQKLFTPTSSTGITKQVPFKDLDDFTFTLSQIQGTSENQRDATSLQINTVNLTDSVKSLTAKGCKKEEISTSFGIRLDPTFGLPEVVEGTVSCEVEVVEKDGSVLDSVKGMFGFGSGKKDDTQQIIQDEDWAEFSSKVLSESASSSSSAKDSKATDKAKDKAKDTPSPPKKKTEIVKIKFTASQDSGKAKSEDFERMKERLASFDRADRARKDREEDINNLESFIYKVRDYLSDESFITFSSSAVRDQLEKLREETSEWMSDASSATSSELKEKLKALKAIVSPVLSRKAEAQKRPEFVELMQQALNQTKMLISVIQDSIEEAARSEASTRSLVEEMKSAAAEAEASVSASTDSAEASPTSDPLADLEEDLPPAWSSTASSPSTTPAPEPYLTPYTAEDLQELADEYEAVASWLEEKLAAQEQLQPWEEPVFESKELERKTKRLNDALVGIIQKKMVRSKGGKAKSGKGKTKSAGKKGKGSASGETSGSANGGEAASSGKDAKVRMGVDHNEL